MRKGVFFIRESSSEGRSLLRKGGSLLCEGVFFVRESSGGWESSGGSFLRKGVFFVRESFS